MTIIAGFRVQDGILLCSDTEWSGGAKAYREKIFTHNFRGGVISFAISGHEANAKMAIEDCQDALHVQRKTAYTAIELKEIIRQAVHDVYVKYVDKIPKVEREESRFDLIIGLKLRSGHMELLSSVERSVLQVADGFACQGAGWFAGLPIIKSAYDPNMRIKDAVIVGMQAMGAAKRQVNGVGGHSQFLVMGEQFVSDLIGHDPAESERLILQYEQAAGRLLLQAGDFDLDNSAFKEKVVNFGRLVINLRTEWAATAAPYRELIEELSKPSSNC